MRTESSNAALRIGGVDANHLAQTYGTPLLALDGGRLDDAIATFESARSALGIEVSYAAKALFFVALARRLARSDIGIDVCSLGELLTAEAAGFPAERLTFHGCGKTDDELRAACAGRVGRIVVDDVTEIERLRAVARAPLDVLVRVNTGLEARTHAHVRTTGTASKFGVLPQQLDDVVYALERCAYLRIRGVHSHIGSQILDADAFVENVPLGFAAFARLRTRVTGADTLVLGGGFGVDSDPSAAPFDTPATLARMAAAARSLAQASGLPAPVLGVEPGRALVAAAGSSLYRVIAVKDNGTARFAIVDGSIADNPRPALYGSYHHPHLAGRVAERGVPAEPFVICGRSCESDQLVTAPLPIDLRAGDLLALDTTGAYTYSMASNYNRFPRPAIVLAARGEHRLVVRRESSADQLRNDVCDQ